MITFEVHLKLTSLNFIVSRFSILHTIRVRYELTYYISGITTKMMRNNLHISNSLFFYRPLLCQMSKKDYFTFYLTM